MLFHQPASPWTRTRSRLSPLGRSPVPCPVCVGSSGSPAIIAGSSKGMPPSLHLSLNSSGTRGLPRPPRPPPHLKHSSRPCHRYQSCNSQPSTDPSWWTVMLQAPGSVRCYAKARERSLSSVVLSPLAILSSMCMKGSSSGSCKPCGTSGHTYGGVISLYALTITPSSSCSTNGCLPFLSISG